MKVRHGINWNGNDYTLCGLALEAYEDKMVDSPVVLAKAKELVTCPECLKVIFHCRRSFYTQGKLVRSLV